MAIFYTGGIALDRWLNVDWTAWLITGALVVVGWLFVQRRIKPILSLGLLLAGCLCVGGARHYAVWSAGKPDDVELFTSEETVPVRLVGTLHTDPEIRVRKPYRFGSQYPQSDRSVCFLDCRIIKNGAQETTVSGRTRLSVNGHLSHVRAGDEVEVFGRLSRISGPTNPGEFDYQNYLRRQQTRCTTYVHSPDAVRRLNPRTTSSFKRWRGRVRHECETMFSRHLRKSNVAVASALLLGNRSQMSDDVRRAFVESGTMHLLAISGLHVGILAALFWIGCRLLNLSPTATSIVVLTGIIAYATITTARPPVVRATVVVFVVAVGHARYRQLFHANTLAISALLVLGWNPADLFEAGAQLSFLAVMALIWSNSRQGCPEPTQTPVDLKALAERKRWIPPQALTAWKRLKKG